LPRYPGCARIPRREASGGVDVTDIWNNRVLVLTTH
jgi:hypothetical protein